MRRTNRYAGYGGHPNVDKAFKEAASDAFKVAIIASLVIAALLYAGAWLVIQQAEKYSNEAGRSLKSYSNYDEPEPAETQQGQQ